MDQRLDLSLAALGTWLYLGDRGGAFFTDLRAEWLLEPVRSWWIALRRKWTAGSLSTPPEIAAAMVEIGIEGRAQERAIASRFPGFEALAPALKQAASGRVVGDACKAIVELAAAAKWNETKRVIRDLENRMDAIEDYVPARRIGEIPIEEVLAIPESIPTGMRIDEATCGFPVKTATLLYGLTGCGKSTLAYQWARHAASSGKPTMILSTEMEDEDVKRRLVAALSGIPLGDFRRGLSEFQQAGVESALDALEALPLTLRSVKDWTCQEIEPLIRRDAEGVGVKFVILDHVTGLRLGGEEGRYLRGYDHVRACFVRLRKEARRSGVHLLAIGHLNRQAAAARTKGEEQGLEHAAASYAANYDADLSLVLESRSLSAGRANRLLKIEKSRYSADQIRFPLVYDGDRATFRDTTLEEVIS